MQATPDPRLDWRVILPQAAMGSARIGLQGRVFIVAGVDTHAMPYLTISMFATVPPVVMVRPTVRPY